MPKTNILAAGLVCTAIVVASPPSARAQKPAERGMPMQRQQMMMHEMTDAEFVPMMIRHHRHGIEMARHEEERGSSPAVQALAARIRQSQEKELAELEAHAAKTAGAKGTSGYADQDKMMEQQSQGMMKRLKSASGEELDRMFLEQMARHHQMAIQMTERTTFQNDELRKLSEKMVAGQRQELSELEKLQSGTPSK